MRYREILDAVQPHVAFNKIQDFVEQLGLGKHDLSAAGHVIKVMATNSAPLATNTVKGDLTEITAQNGYPAGGSDIQNTWSETGGTATMGATDVVWTATGGSFGPLRYIPAYNDTQATPAKPLIGWWDYGSSPTVADTETFTVDFTNILTIA